MNECAPIIFAPVVNFGPLGIWVTAGLIACCACYGFYHLAKDRLAKQADHDLNRRQRAILRADHVPQGAPLQVMRIDLKSGMWVERYPESEEGYGG